MKVVFWWKKGRNVYVNPISRSGGDCNGNLEMPGPSDTGSLECIWGVLYNKRDKNFEKKKIPVAMGFVIGASSLAVRSGALYTNHVIHVHDFLVH